MITRHQEVAVRRAVASRPIAAHHLHAPRLETSACARDHLSPEPIESILELWTTGDSVRLYEKLDKTF
jgi:hypothetical protein